MIRHDVVREATLPDTIWQDRATVIARGTMVEVGDGMAQDQKGSDPIQLEGG